MSYDLVNMSKFGDRRMKKQRVAQALLDNSSKL